MYTLENLYHREHYERERASAWQIASSTTRGAALRRRIEANGERATTDMTVALFPLASRSSRKTSPQMADDGLCHALTCSLSWSAR